MNFYVIIPAHNEEAFLADTLNAVLRQTLQPKKVVIVNDNSTDGTAAIIDEFAAKHAVLQKLDMVSTNEHLPGSKVVNAFNKALGLLDDDYDFLVKLDADVIIPNDYFERLAAIFKKNPKVGIAGGFVYERSENNVWKLNHPMDKNHVRGAFKAYTRSCFKAIGGLKNAMGWDTVDELLAQYHGFEVFTDASLHVKHLRPTGNAYGPKAKLLQGQAMYAMRYGFAITLIASLKMAWKQKKWTVLGHNLNGYVQAKLNHETFLVTAEEGKFVRRLRWRNIFKKLLK